LKSFPWAKNPRERRPDSGVTPVAISAAVR
jgi:hypothetical protein